MTKMSDEPKIDQIVAGINSELEPILDRIRVTPKIQLTAFKEAYERFTCRSKNSIDLWSSIQSGKYIEEYASISEQVRELYSYLGMIESLGNCYVDMLVMLLIANGRDFHIESKYSTPRIRHVTSIEDLEKETTLGLGTKLGFLKTNGLPFIVSLIDNTLRNDIAHLNCKVVNGKVLVRGKTAEEAVDPAERN
jgi:hypothetical protein